MVHITSSAGITTIRVRYNECDPMGVAHHAVYPVWFEIGRTELLRATGRSYRELEERGFLLAVVSLEVKYRKPARYDDALMLETTLADAGHVKIKHSYALRRGSELLATADSTLACLDRRGKVQPIPDGLLG